MIKRLSTTTAVTSALLFSIGTSMALPKDRYQNHHKPSAQATIQALKNELKSLKQEAMEDKKAAIEQVLDLLPDNYTSLLPEKEHDLTFQRSFFTRGFHDFAADHPWAWKDASAGVGRAVIALKEGGISGGSLVLLDADGTVVMAAHEREPGKMRAAFHIYATEQIVKGTVSAFQYDVRHDVMFGHLTMDDNKSVVEDELKPVHWLPTDDVAQEDTDGIVALGYAEAEDHLHVARTGQNIELEDHVSVRNKPAGTDCKIEGTNGGFGGMSGGGVFSMSGEFFGIDNSGAGPGKYTDHETTPSTFIRGAYVMLLPANAKKAGVTAPDTRTWPEACRPRPEDFVKEPQVQASQP